MKIVPFNFYLISPLGLLALGLLWRRSRSVGLWYVFIMVLTGFVFIFHIQSRYRIPFVPFYILGAAYSVFWIYEKMRSREYKVLGPAVIVLMGLGVFTSPDRFLMSRYFDGGIRSIDYSNMAGAYLYRIEKTKMTGPAVEADLKKAISYYDRALLHLPLFAQADILLTQATIYHDLNEPGPAFDKLYKILRINPEHRTARYYYALWSRQVIRR